jgi:hypothetical protein
MSKTTAIIIVIILMVIGFIAAINFNLIPKNQIGPYDNFIICMKSSGVKLYGDYANVDSLRQMSFFGDSLYTLEKSGMYIECNPYGPNPKVSKCQKAGIKFYPTWEINGKQYLGITGLNKLEELTGCKRES